MREKGIKSLENMLLVVSSKRQQLFREHDGWGNDKPVKQGESCAQLISSLEVNDQIIITSESCSSFQ
jgi:hypothetical protein